MRTYGLKPHEQADVWEATRIAERMAQEGETTAGTTRAPAEESTRGDLGTSPFKPCLLCRNSGNYADSVFVDPHLSVSGREIIKSFGGWTNFLHAYNLKEYNQVDVWEGKRIVERMLKESEAVPVPTSSKTG